MGPTFKWDDEGDPLDGFDTDPEPTPEPPTPPVAKPSPHKQMAKPSKVAEIIDELEESPDPAELSEAEWRLEKAGYYRAVINSQLLSSDHPAAVEVELELQKWAKEQLETLLGLRSTTAASAPLVSQESPFNPEETAILKQLASRALDRQAQQPSQPPAQTPVAAPVKTPTPVQPAVAKPKAQVVPVEEQGSRRGRGRPRKNPCRICGKMECEHKRVVSQPQPQTAPHHKASDQPSGEMYEGLVIQFAPDGMRFVESPDGRRYRLDLRQVTHKKTGEVREAYIPVELSKPQVALGGKPYPSEQEVIQMAALEAERNAGAMSSLTAATGVTGRPTKFTGTDLINAAMGAPERESYVPEPPPRKR
jgi:hypothetical protein